jgi:hypothetical protein
MSRKEISGYVNAMRQYRKKEKISFKNNLSLDIDDFRLKGWMPAKIAGRLTSGRSRVSAQGPWEANRKWHFKKLLSATKGETKIVKLSNL